MPSNAAANYRAQAKVCKALAESAPNESIRQQWLALAESYRRAADALLPKKPNTRTG